MTPTLDFADIRKSCPNAFAALEKHLLYDWEITDSGQLQYLIEEYAGEPYVLQYNVRDLFDFFDQAGIITAITPISENPVEYFWRMNLSNIKPGPCGTHPTRAAAEAAAFTAGFAKLEEMLGKEMRLDDILIDRYVVVTSTRHPWAYFCRGRIVAFDLDARTVMLFIEKDHGDCEFITFFVHEVELAEEEPLFAEPTDGWFDHKLQDLSTIAHLYPPPPPRRPLSSLTETEAREVYRLAFGDDYEPDTVVHYHFPGQPHSISTWQYTKELFIQDNGIMSASHDEDGALWTVQVADEFNATKVVRYLDSIGIEIG